MNIKKYLNKKQGQAIKLKKTNGGVVMAILAKDRSNMFAIRQEKARDFIIESNKNKISNSFIKECKEISKLFKKKN
ncbi:hypothetical protein DVV91_09790 [Clostridium botulinum]|uniref:hypothetical protein n=1 Tax=Clostridium botulinum TaxID=1491 RepID=UPI001966F9E3|nr:hypothetical protein [Clostridium botulinum]MBN1074631.1 hypothetical protein [Clostridium botulinum]